VRNRDGQDLVVGDGDSRSIDRGDHRGIAAAQAAREQPVDLAEGGAGVPSGRVRWVGVPMTLHDSQS
jgi:hypothetical protein